MIKTPKNLTTDQAIKLRELQLLEQGLSKSVNGILIDKDKITQAVRKEMLSTHKQFLDSLPRAKDGKDGAKGKDGSDGKDAVLPANLVENIASDVMKRITMPENGKDAEITQDLIDSIVSEVVDEIDVPSLPDFKELLTSENEAVRDGLELLRDKERLKATAIDEEGLSDLIKKHAPKQKIQGGGGMSNERVKQIIAEEGVGGVTDGDKGDITVSNSGATWTIDDEAVNLEKIEHIAHNHFLGRNSSGLGDVESLSAAQTRAALGLSDVATSNDYNDLDNKPDLTAFDELEAFADLASFPATGESDKIYLAEDTGYIYRWSGSTYVQISSEADTLATVTARGSTTDGDITVNGDIEAENYNIPTGTKLTNHYSAILYGELLPMMKGAWSEVLAFKTPYNIEYWDGSAWQDYSSATSDVEKLLTGHTDTGNFQPPVDKRKWRFTLDFGSDKWNSGGMFEMFIDYTAGGDYGSGAKPANVFIERDATDAFADPTTIIDDVSEDDRAVFSKIATFSSAEQYYRFTLEGLDTTAATRYNYFRLYTSRTSYGNQMGLPMKWDNDKTVKMEKLRVEDDTDLRGDLVVDTDTFYVDSTNSRVGMGTLSPNAANHVYGAETILGVDGVVAEFADSTGNSLGTGAAMLFTADTTRVAAIKGIKEVESGSRGGLALYTRDGGDLIEKARLDKDGNLGIGTTSPSEKLEVNDTIKAKMFKATVSALGNLGSTEAIDWRTANIFTGTLDSNVTITFANAEAGDKITMNFAYDGSAQRTITFPSVKFPDGYTLAAPSASGEVLKITVEYDGTNYLAAAQIHS